MERDDVEGAEAAARYFLELHPYVFATGDLAEWRMMSHPECDFCAGSASHVADLFAAGGYAVGGHYEIGEVVMSEPAKEQDYYLAAVRGVEAPSVEYSAEGNVTAQFDGGAFEYYLALTLESGKWIVRGVNWEG